MVVVLLLAPAAATVLQGGGRLLSGLHVIVHIMCVVFVDERNGTPPFLLAFVKRAY